MVDSYDSTILSDGQMLNRRIRMYEAGYLEAIPKLNLNLTRVKFHNFTSVLNSIEQPLRLVTSLPVALNDRFRTL